jgi:TonB family protein
MVRAESGVCVDEPKLIRNVKPEYPGVKKAMAMREPVTVELTAVVDRIGKVTEVTPVAPFVDKDFEYEAIKAVKKWRYTPTLDASGKPVEVYLAVSITFEPPRAR